MIEIDKSYILSELMRYKNFTSKADFARFLDITPQGLATWFSRNSFDINKIASRFPEVNDIWLLTGKGNMLKDNESTTTVATINYEGKGVPYYDIDFLCGFDEIENNQTINPEHYIDFKQYNNADYWINASGDSMRPVISPGDILAVRQLPDSEWDAHIMFGETYAIITPHNRTIKKVRKSKLGDDYILLVPENTEEYDEQDVKKRTVRRVFQVLGCMKRLM